MTVLAHLGSTKMIKWGITTIWIILINGIIIPLMMYGPHGPTSFGAPFAYQIFMSIFLGVIAATVADEYFKVEDDE